MNAFLLQNKSHKYVQTKDSNTGVGVRGVSQWLEGWRLQSQNHGDFLSVEESKLQACMYVPEGWTISASYACPAQEDPWAQERVLGKTGLWNPLSFIFLHLRFLEKRGLTI